jgi:hypothetical protein
MAKICKVEGCDQNVFGSGYCKRHQYLRDDIVKSIKTLNKPIRKLSVKRKKQMDTYIELKAEIIAEAKRDGLYLCRFCGKRFEDTDTVEIHHLLGRIEDKLIDKKDLILVHRQCHTEYHSLTVEQLYRTEWYRWFLMGLHYISPEAYKKEQRRINKAGL